MNVAPSYNAQPNISVPAINTAGQPEEITLRASKRAKVLTDLHDAGVVPEAAAGRAIADVVLTAQSVIPGGVHQDILLNTITNAVAGAMAPLVQRLDAIDQRLGANDQRLGAIDQRLDTIDQRLDTIDQGQERMAAQLANQRLESADSVLHRVSNAAGTFPDALPAGTTLATLQSLATLQVDACIQHYSLSNAGGVEKKRERLRLHLGARKAAMVP